MLYLSSLSADNLYLDVLHNILRRGQITHPRGFTCLELSPCCIKLEHPNANIISNPVRKINKGFAAAELLWMLSGRNDVDFVNFYNSNMAKFSDDGLTFFGAYGPKLLEQFPYIEYILKKDPWTRQAVLNIWRECPPETKDVPCTINMQFIRRPLNKLNLHVNMRSQDVWLGLPYDLHNFTSIQIIMSSILGLEPGAFYLTQGSLHAYKENFGEMETALSQSALHIPLFTTPNSSCKNVEDLKCWAPIIQDVNKVLTEGELPKYTADFLDSRITDTLLQQKLNWMFEFASKKRTK